MRASQVSRNFGNAKTSTGFRKENPTIFFANEFGYFGYICIYIYENDYMLYAYCLVTICAKKYPLTLAK